MELHSIPVETAVEYVDLAKKFAGLVDKEMKRIETTPEPQRTNTIAQAMPRLISMVNVVGYFSGQDGAFYDVWPEDMTGAESRRDLHGNELVFEDRLNTLIAELRSSSEAGSLKERLEQYYIKART